MTATILLIDDDISILRMIRMGLKQAGYQVVTAQDGVNALEKLEEMTPDLIISDVMMPRIGGLELVRAIRKRTATTRTPIIMLTSLTRYDDMKMSYDLGADFYLTKPFDLKALLDAISNLLPE
ncbi:response regulator [bacterium]|nr:response regulator [candidate division CSSED10-310 bacterium]